MGGLGNQLFQICTTISYAIKSRDLFAFLNVTELGSGFTTKRFTYWDTFFSNLKPYLISVLPKNLKVIRETNFMYNELPVNEMINNDVLLYGYFQSYKYFNIYNPTIHHLLDIYQKKKDVLNLINNIYNGLNITNNSINNTISIHFRLGDYKKLQHYHPLMSCKYYELSLDKIKIIYPNVNFTIFYFCEEDDITDVLEKITILQSKFKEFTFIRGEKTLTDWQQMIFMSCCQHNIIANSSFSWWSAYFNNRSDKIVCYPNNWFGPGVKNDIKDLCPPEWIKISI
jgi:hypothetical protein